MTLPDLGRIVTIRKPTRERKEEMKIYDYRGDKVILSPDAAQNTPENAVVRVLQHSDPNDPTSKLFIKSGASTLAFRHELVDTGEEFTP